MSAVLWFALPILACWILAFGEEAKAEPTEITKTVATATPWFTEIAGAAGLDFVHDSGHQQKFRIPESVALHPTGPS